MAKANVSRISIVALAVSASLLCFSANAAASEKERITELEERLDMLEVELIEAKDAASQADRVEFSKSSPSPEIISKDGRSTLEFKARIQADVVKADEMYVTDDRIYQGEFTDTSIRRLRFGIEGYFSNVWEYELEFDFDGISEVEVKDAKIDYKGWDDQQLTIGYQKYSFGQEATNNSAYIAFMERASTDAFAPDRALGLQWRYKGDDYTVSLGYGMDFNVEEDEGEYTNPQLSIMTARAIYTPISSKGHLLHIGASAMNIDNNDDLQKMRYRARPSIKPGDRTISTGKFKADGAQHYGAELIYQNQNWLVSGEYVTSVTDQIDGETVNLDAYYLQTVYTLTGEAWRYSRKKGVFKGVRPNNAISAGGYGAWELALRVDQADFTDASAGIDGGRKTDYTFGINWYLENNLRAQFNYVRTNADYDNPFEDKNGVMQYEQDANIFQARIQFAY